MSLLQSAPDHQNDRTGLKTTSIVSSFQRCPPASGNGPDPTPSLAFETASEGLHAPSERGGECSHHLVTVKPNGLTIVPDFSAPAAAAVFISARFLLYDEDIFLGLRLRLALTLASLG